MGESELTPINRTNTTEFMGVEDEEKRTMFQEFLEGLYGKETSEVEKYTETALKEGLMNLLSIDTLLHPKEAFNKFSDGMVKAFIARKYLEGAYNPENKLSSITSSIREDADWFNKRFINTYSELSKDSS